jgi:DNA-binding response OmpR family regulator
MPMPANIQAVVFRLVQAGDTEAATLIRDLAMKLAPSTLAVNLNTNMLVYGGTHVKLSPNQAVVMSELVRAYPRVVSVPHIFRSVWGAACAERNINTVRVMMTDLRKALGSLNLQIRNQHGSGYYVELPQVT